MNINPALKLIRVVLVQPTHMGNIGACARAMKVMGLTQLMLVGAAPLTTEAYERACGAAVVLDHVQHYGTLLDAVQDTVCVIAASARSRSVPWPLHAPREAAEMLVKISTQGAPSRWCWAVNAPA